MALVAAFTSQIYSRLLGACIFTLPAWLRVANVAVLYLCRRLWCGCTTWVRCGNTTRVRCAVTRLVCDVWETKTQIVGSGHEQVVKMGLVPHFNPRNTGKFCHMTATLSYLRNQFD